MNMISMPSGNARNGSIPRREQIIHSIAAQHDERAMRKIDDVEHAPDERHAKRHQAIQAAQQNSVQEDLGVKHSSCVLSAIRFQQHRLPFSARSNGDRIFWFADRAVRVDRHDLAALDLDNDLRQHDLAVFPKRMRA